MKTIHYVLFGIVYTFVYFFLAIMSTGGGHGNFFLLTPFLTWIFLIIALFLLARLNNFIFHVFFITLIISHYVLTLLMILSVKEDIIEDWSKIARRQGIFITTGVYLLGQLIIWWFYYLSVKNRKELS